MKDEIINGGAGRACAVDVGTVRVFADIDTSKAQALKVLEEAAEVFGAWQGGSLRELLDECADVIQATCNLLAAYGVGDFSACMEACRERNIVRGREYRGTLDRDEEAGA